MTRIFGIIVFLLSLVAPALADPATHEFKIASAKTLSSDCGGGTCVNSCVVHVVLSRIGHDTAPDLAVSFKAVAVGDPDPGRSMRFSFKSGDRVESVDHLDRITCKGLRLSEPSVECTDDSSKCRRYIKISIKPYKNPKVEARKVELP